MSVIAVLNKGLKILQYKNISYFMVLILIGEKKYFKLYI